MRLPIYLYGHPVLRRISEPVTPDYPDLRTFIDNMFDTMYASDGVGVAAPQVGRNVRIVVIDADPVKESCPECAGRKMVLINPVVTILDGDKVSRPEGCLSLPGLSENVQRVEHINLQYLDADFNPHNEEISGFLARIVQHECDHLEGKVYTDHISAIRRQLIKAKLNNIAAGSVACDYPTKSAPRRTRR